METDLLTELIARKHAILEQLRDLSRRQPDLIGEGDMGRLLAILSAKQSLLGELQKVERQLDPFRHQDPEARRWRSQQDRQRTRDLAQRCESLLREIMLIEKQSESDLLLRRDQAAARLEGAHTAAEARTAYTATEIPQHSQLDLSSEV